MLLAELEGVAVQFARLEAPAAPGVYAYFLRAGTQLPAIANPGGDAVYVGLSTNLAQREFDTHFKTGQTGFSTLRRSIGALLKDELQLTAVPRGTGSSPSNFTNYRFRDADEQRLTDWMLANLRVGVHAVADPTPVEDELIALACPPLNLKGWANPDAAAIKALRKACADEARGAK